MAEPGGPDPAPQRARAHGTQQVCSAMRHLLRHACMVLLACMALRAQALTLDLRAAQASVTVQGQTTHAAVALPYHWDRQHTGLPGVASFDLPFSLQELPTGPYGLYVSRLGNAYEIWLNGALLERNGDLRHFNGPDYAKAPRFVDIAPGLLRAQNVFHVLIRADVGRRGGLAPLVLGPHDEVLPLYESDFRWRNTGSMIVSLLSLLVGVVALALWATQVDPSLPGRRRRARRDRLYLFAGLAQLSWALVAGDAMLENPPMAWPWWGIVMVVVMTVSIGTMALFCVEIAGWGRLRAVRWLRRWIAVPLGASAGAAAGALEYGFPLALTLWYATLSLAFVVLLPLFIHKAVRGGSVAHKIVAAAMLLNTLVGLRDIYAFRLSPTYGGTTMLRYSAVVFALALAYVVIMRLRSASRQVRALMASMASQVLQKEKALHLSYQRVEQLAREQERAGERARILRDMHDGVGSHISTAIRQLQSGKASDGEVLRTLRDSLDQLKLSIDAMNVPPGDINALLANIRYRLEPRFMACDIQLLWEVDLLEPVASLDASAMAQLQFMLFEAFSNVLQHAHASTLCVSARPLDARGPGIRLQVIDNGRGFDLARPGQRGLLSMQERARAIGVTLQLHSAPGRTVVEITIA